MPTLAVAALVLATTADAANSHHRHRRHRSIVDRSIGQTAAQPISAQDRAATQSGFAFGLLDLGISGAPTAISPYAGYGYVGRGDDGPGFAYPGY